VWKIQLFIIAINYILKYIHIENHYFKPHTSESKSLPFRSTIMGPYFRKILNIKDFGSRLNCALNYTYDVCQFKRCTLKSKKSQCDVKL